ncbi:homeobox protein Mohawk isoform X1 [Diabrotica virgifera virgifera]|uniref:Homeobox protein Mohawk isoform X1 n=1 Tax=Diabrotica virgifera virgifera TaxID=50390 RepID=A0A6P7FH12_DIAVI|nr:homeobox protein Mohawk isoform X1 [Diabrotica virgifera virgifera]
MRETESSQNKTALDVPRLCNSVFHNLYACLHLVDPNKKLFKAAVHVFCYRRAYGEEKRPPKMLFTPEIKRYLKDWLVRRRENPYPNRDEKKMLAVQTGLTYIQVCNWFANWRRKLKNAGREPHKKTWSSLIKTYNNQVQGNVEHLSICSNDSIWEESDKTSSYTNDKYAQEKHLYEETYFNNNNNDIQNQCYYISSTTENDHENPFSQNTCKYKNHMMEKYLRDCQKPFQTSDDTKPMMSKWLKSAANFIPSESSYLDWTLSKININKKRLKINEHGVDVMMHGREELDAAEALTTLANSIYKL